MMTPQEREVVGLAVCIEALNSLVNHAVLQFTPVSNQPGEMEVRFHNSAHRDLFLIRLQDFLSEKGCETVLGAEMTCVEVLQAACAQRQFEVGGSGTSLTTAVTELTEWLAAPLAAKLWLPTIDVEAKLRVTRAQMLRIAGNQAKHNPSRLSRVAKFASKLLREQGYDVPPHLIPFVLNDFRDHLHDNFFIYYASWTAELLNNVRWGVQRYLEPLLHQSLIPEDGDFPRWHYLYPAEVTSDVAQAWFRELMGRLTSPPPVRPFKASGFLREQSSLEW